MDDPVSLVFRKPDEIKERLEFPHAVLQLLKETDLFGPVVEKALEDVNFLIEKAGRWR